MRSRTRTRAWIGATLTGLVAAAAVLVAPATQAAPPPDVHRSAEKPSADGSSAGRPPADAPGTKIVGGRPASEPYPYTSSLQVGGRHGCGASLISDQWLVTAAHCVQGQSRLNVRIGSPNRSSGGTLATSARLIPHPSYRGLPGSYDVALVQLSQPVAGTPVAIADASPAQGSDVRLLGWGQTCPQRGCDQGSEQLKELDTRINPDSMCSGGFDPSNELCVYSTSQATACYGDSGGPLLVRAGGEWRLAGATSRAGANSPTCGGGNSTIYTDVTAHREWIESTAGLR